MTPLRSRPDRHMRYYVLVLDRLGVGTVELRGPFKLEATARYLASRHQQRCIVIYGARPTVIE